MGMSQVVTFVRTFAQGGDFLFGDGTGSESVYGGKFADEGFSHTHDREVCATTAPLLPSALPHTTPTPTRDRVHVVTQSTPCTLW